MAVPDFAKRVNDVQDRIASIQPSLADISPDTSAPDAAVWRRGPYHATLSLHSDSDVPSLRLLLLTGETEHPDPLDIGFGDPDVVDMIARPIAALLSQRES